MEGPEKIDTYVSLFMSKFIHANGYSELPMDYIRVIVRKYLISDYNDEIHSLQRLLQQEQAENIPINRDWYQNEVGKAKAKFLKKVEEVSYMGDVY